MNDEDIDVEVVKDEEAGKFIKAKKKKQVTCCARAYTIMDVSIYTNDHVSLMFIEYNSHSMGQFKVTCF